MLLAGKGCAKVALAVGVARQTVYTWKRLLDEGGIDALREVPTNPACALLKWRKSKATTPKDSARRGRLISARDQTTGRGGPDSSRERDGREVRLCSARIDEVDARQRAARADAQPGTTKGIEWRKHDDVLGGRCPPGLNGNQSNRGLTVWTAGTQRTDMRAARDGDWRRMTDADRTAADTMRPGAPDVNAGTVACRRLPGSRAMRPENGSKELVEPPRFRVNFG